MTPNEWITLIVQRANELRRVGVRSLDLDGVRFTLDPAEPIAERAEPIPIEPDNFLDHPATYGRVSGVPGFERPKDDY